MSMLTKLFHYSVAFGLSAVVLLSCQGKDGDPGPQGDAGAAGAAGGQGLPGGAALMRTRSGFITGSITGLRADGVTPINETFNYQFRRETNFLSTDFDLASGTSVRQTRQPGIYKFSIDREDSLLNRVFRLAFHAPLDLSSDAVVISAYFTFNKDMGNNQVMGVDGSFYLGRGQAPTARVTNLQYDQNSGLLRGDFYWEAGEGLVNTSSTYYQSVSGSGKPFILSGSFRVQAPLVSSLRRGVNPK